MVHFHSFVSHCIACENLMQTTENELSCLSPSGTGRLDQVSGAGLSKYALRDLMSIMSQSTCRLLGLHGSLQPLQHNSTCFCTAVTTRMHACYSRGLTCLTDRTSGGVAETEHPWTHMNRISSARTQSGLGLHASSTSCHHSRQLMTSGM